MENLVVTIPARSRQQAMDWGLVLASQGIEAAIDRDPETGRWQLRVAPAESSRAWESIRLYLKENRRRRWQRAVEFAGLVFDWRALGWALVMAGLFALSEMPGSSLRLAGRMDATAVLAGQWWRLITATTLHADAGHLAANLSTGILLVGLAMGAYGVGGALMGLLAAGVAGNLASLVLHGPPYLSLGASGMVMGALGLLAAHTVSSRRQTSLRRMAGRGALASILLLVLFGMDPNADVLAHVGGFAGGGLAGAALLWLPSDWWTKRWVSPVLTLLAALTVMLAWGLALARQS